MSIFKGAGVAIVTPMYENGEVNYDGFGKLIEFQIENKTDAIVVCGTTGEASTLTHEEHLDVIRYCVKAVNGRVPVIAGTGSNCTETAIYLSQEAEQAGADGLLVVSPYYNKATQNGLYTHFKMIAESVKIPVLLYNVPGRTGCNILPETVVRLCKDVENIIGVKEASGNISQIAHWPLSPRTVWICIPETMTRVCLLWHWAVWELFPYWLMWRRSRRMKSVRIFWTERLRKAVKSSLRLWSCAMHCSVK